MTATGTRRLRAFLVRELRDLPPGRRLRTRLAVEAIEDYARTRGDDSGTVPSLLLLDAGSEEGLLCLALARRHPRWRFVAADISLTPLLRGQGWSHEAGLAVSYVCCDLQRVVAEGTFDVVVALESLVEIPDDRAALASMVAAIAPGGLFVAQVPTADWTPVLRSADRSWRREARHGYDASQLVHLLDGLGLDVREVTPTFRRATALAQDVRDRYKRGGRWTRLAMLPVMAGAVAAERRGVTWGPARGLFVVAVKR
ncbi:MAG: class I SAM-dependent methyltransferase [Marmoricola sp.]